MAKAVTSKLIRLRNVRLSFPQIVEPKAFEAGQRRRYEATALLDPSNREHAEILKEVQSEALRIAGIKWGADFDRKTVKLCLQNGDDKSYEGYAGMKYISSAQPEDPTRQNNGRPKIYNRNAVEIMPGDKEWPYGGATVNLDITLWTQDNKYGKRINANFIALQFVLPTPAFGRGEVASSFEKLPQDAAAATVDGEADPFG